MVSTALQRSAQVDIWNNVFFLFNFPTESFLEARETLAFLLRHIDVIDTSNYNVFCLQRGSYVHKNREEFSITHIWESGFFNDLQYETEGGMRSTELQDIMNYYSQVVLEFQIDSASLLGEDVHRILPIPHHRGKAGVKKVQQEKKKELEKLRGEIARIEASCLRLAPGVHFSEIWLGSGLQDKVYLAVNEETGQVLGINEFSSHLFELLKKGFSFKEMISEVSAHDTKDLEPELKRGLIQLLIDKWIEVVS